MTELSQLLGRCVRMGGVRQRLDHVLAPKCSTFLRHHFTVERGLPRMEAPPRERDVQGEARATIVRLVSRSAHFHFICFVVFLPCAERRAVHLNGAYPDVFATVLAVRLLRRLRFLPSRMGCNSNGCDGRHAQVSQVVRASWNAFFSSLKVSDSKSVYSVVCRRRRRFSPDICVADVAS